jgi:hypothetical protein
MRFSTFSEPSFSEGPLSEISAAAHKIPDQEMKALETNGTLTRHQFHPEWNYTLNPTQHDTPDAS